MKNLLLRLSAAFVLLIPSVASAIPPAEIWVYCGNLPGCGPGWNEYVTSALSLLSTLLPNYALAIGTLFIMVGGAYIILAAGRDDMVTKGKSTITWAVIGIAVIRFAVDAIGFVFLEIQTRIPASDLVFSVSATLVDAIFNLLYVSLFGVALYCGMRMVLSFGKQDQFDKAKDGLFYAAVGAIVINLAQYIAGAIASL